MDSRLTQFRAQLNSTQRLVEGMGTLVKEGEDEEGEEEEDHFTALSRYHRSLLETGREWLCARTLSQPRLSRMN